MTKVAVSDIKARPLQGQTADCGSAMRQVSVESFIASLAGWAASLGDANLIDLRYSKISSIWILRLFPHRTRLKQQSVVGSGNLPVVKPTIFHMAINTKTAKSLGIELPPGLLGLADEFIE